MAGKTFLVWCAEPGLYGTVLWGAPDRADLDGLFAAWRLFESLPGGYAVIMDARRIARFEPALYEPVLAFARELTPTFDPRLVRLALLLPDSVAGMSVAGIYPLAGISGKWRPFDDEEAAFAWASPTAGLRVQPRVDELARQLRNETTVVDALRRFLATTPSFPPIAEAARALDRSARSLQRELAAAGTSYRAELDYARIQRTRELLVESDMKIEAIAARVGCATASSLTRLFRRVVGQSPSDYRAAHRPGGGGADA